MLPCFLAVFCLSATVFTVTAVAALPPVTLVHHGVRCWHDVAYGERGDLPDEGEGFTGKHGGWGSPDRPWKWCRHRSGQFLDVFASERGVATNAPVVLYLHGGSWSQCFDKDATPVDLFGPLLAGGAVVGTANYILQSDITVNKSKPARKEATFAEMLRDIDAAVAKMGSFASALGVAEPRLVIMGESAGGHLALLYAYDQDNPAKLGLGLKHAPRVAKVVDIVGPTAFAEKDFINSITLNLIFFKIRNRIFDRLMRRLVGLPDGAPEDEALQLLAKWSPVDLVCPQSVPTVLAYGKTKKRVDSDGLVLVSQFTLLERKLAEAGVPCAARMFFPANHVEVRGKGAKWIAEQTLPGVANAGTVETGGTK
jgi:acetyl esterase/lipase